MSHTPVDKITAGEIAFFDAYWDIPTKTINNNLCPPKIVTTTVGEEAKAARADANIDIAKSVIHVTNKYKVTVVNSSAANYDPNAVSGTTIDVAEYPFLKNGLEDGVVFDANGTATTSDGDPVQFYWLQLDDPDTTDVNEASDIVLGFSTELFEGKYREARDGNKPFYYEFESERDYKSEVHGPHFFAFEAPLPDNGVQGKAVWDSYDAETNKKQMEAGQRQNLQWVFTEPGTHHIEVHVVGHVNQNPTDPSDDWKKNPPEEKTVTSEVQVYTIQTGPLTFNDDPPVFTAGTRTVATDAAAGTFLSGPIAMWADGRQSSELKFEVLNYREGSVSQEFEPYAYDPDGFGVQGVQLRVKAGADLGDESPDGFELKVTVSDGKDREGHPDDAVDHWITVDVQRKD